MPKSQWREIGFEDLLADPDKVMAEICDFTILVVPYGQAGESDVQAAIETLGEERVIGVIVNKAD